MNFEYVDESDSMKRRYLFHIDENDLLFVDVSTYSESGELVYKQSAAFIYETFVWPQFNEIVGVPDSSIPDHIKKICEKKTASFMKMKVFW